MNGDRAIEMLREALRVSPDNIPLRRHLAESLLSQGRPDEAEAEYREALALDPSDLNLKLGLAGAFLQQGKQSLAAVILEAVIKSPGAPAKAFVLHAKLLFQAGDVEDAVKHYRQGIEKDPSVADQEFADRLGIRSEDSEEETSDEVVEGRVRAAWVDPAADLGIEVERPCMKFTDVGGMESVKDEIRIKIIHPINHPELYRAYGKTISPSARFRMNRAHSWARSARLGSTQYSRSLCRWSPITPSPSRFGRPAAESRLPSEPPPA